MVAHWLKRGVALLSGIVGTLGVAWLVIAMNGAQLSRQDDARGGEVSFSIQAPPKKPQQPRREPRPRPRRESRAKPPPAPVVGASLAGLSFGLDALAGSLGDDMDALLGDLSSVVMTAETVDDLPTPIDQVAPEVPARARAKGIEGLVVVSLLIGVDGRVQDVRVTESRPPGVFDDAVRAAVRQWRFEPAMYQGQPVPLRIDYPFRFQFN
ncbi:MAG: protein TonB [Myxococcota bacterium]|jgi:protein TonB